jgi:hypothetical protein
MISLDGSGRLARGSVDCVIGADFRGFWTSAAIQLALLLPSPSGDSNFPIAEPSDPDLLLALMLRSENPEPQNGLMTKLNPIENVSDDDTHKLSNGRCTLTGFFRHLQVFPATVLRHELYTMIVVLRIHLTLLHF